MCPVVVVLVEGCDGRRFLLKADPTPPPTPKVQCILPAFLRFVKFCQKTDHWYPDAHSVFREVPRLISMERVQSMTPIMLPHPIRRVRVRLAGAGYSYFCTRYSAGPCSHPHSSNPLLRCGSLPASTSSCSRMTGFSPRCWRRRCCRGRCQLGNLHLQCG